ncbi:MAG: hypothetical protein Q7R41_16745 [Phycisphaerales bacterium]|nr:hypothetical protein [Phycisphaerales bacterium]
MIDETYNPNDPLFLASRGLDRDLSDGERGRLNDALIASPTLREDAKRLEAVDRLVKLWGREGVEIDWRHHADLVVASPQTDAEDATLRKIDELIAAWGRRQPVLDERAFADAVLSRITPNRRKTLPMQWVLRIGAPLAAAAAIAMAVTASLWFNPAPVPVIVVLIGRADVQPATVRSGEPKVIVSFARPTDDNHADATDAPGIGYMTIGSSPLPRVGDESAPL